MNFHELRVGVPESEIVESGPAGNFFDILPNSHNLTEEFLYAHQPVTLDTIPIYSTSEKSIGLVDDSGENRARFTVLNGPVILVARKGYAGRLSVIEDPKLIVHEDAYAVIPKPEYQNRLNYHWFAGHYSYEFQSSRTSFWGIGDFPRERFSNMPITMPTLAFQRSVSALYRERDAILRSLQGFEAETRKLLARLIEQQLPRHQEKSTTGKRRKTAVAQRD